MGAFWRGEIFEVAKSGRNVIKCEYEIIKVITTVFIRLGCGEMEVVWDF